ncbi:hypothetical protein HanRHA438_Chr15g0720271 [Helianthus annuus]|nr:hypothetical protein HanRHA438_Chr15g0720271 [Helianthus annuus]
MTQLHILESRQELRTNSDYYSIFVFIFDLIFNKFWSRKMPPVIFRGRGRGRRGRGEIVTHHDNEAGTSGTRHPSMTRSEEPQRRRDLYEPARHSTSHSSTPSYRHSFGPDSENDPNNPQPSFIPLQRSVSHRNYDDPTT